MHQARRAGWDVDYLQIGPGSLQASLAVTTWGTIRFAEYLSNRALLASGASHPGTTSIVLAARPDGTLLCNGQSVEGTHALVARGDYEGIYLTPAGVRFWSATLPASLIAGEAAGAASPGSRIAEPGIVCVRPAELRLLRAVMAAAFAPGREHQDPRVMRIRSAEIEDWLAQAIRCGLDDGDDIDSAAPGRSSRVAYVRRACDYVESHADDVVRLADLADAVGVSLRTLEYAFRDVMGMGPLTYVRTHRLNRARRSLLAGRPEELSVSAVALDHGFGHFGYFARDYKALFGELPRDTLARDDTTS